jgi:hypothetical protein
MPHRHQRCLQQSWQLLLPVHSYCRRRCCVVSAHALSLLVLLLLLKLPLLICVCGLCSDLCCCLGAQCQALLLCLVELGGLSLTLGLQLSNSILVLPANLAVTNKTCAECQ